MASTGLRGATPLAATVNLRRARNASDTDLTATLHPAYAGAVGRWRGGRTVIRGLPFDLGSARARQRWLLLDRPVELDLREQGPATHVVVAHFCDAARGEDGRRPADLPVGWVTPAGELLARYTLETTRGPASELEVRRRFEVNEGLIGWGQGAFAARPHLLDQPLDWRGPHARLVPVGRAPVGEAGLLAILPGAWGPGQTGVADSVPSPTNDLMLWLLEIPVPEGPRRVRRLRLEPVEAGTPGSAIVVAGITLFRGTGSPLALEPRRTLRLSLDGRSKDGRSRIGDADGPLRIGVDLGQIIETRPAPASSDSAAPAPLPGWGGPRTAATSGPGRQAMLVDVAAARDARLTVATETIRAADLRDGAAPLARGRVRIEALRAVTRRVDVEVLDAATGMPVPSRVSFRAGDGRYLPPLGHRSDVNPGLNEDAGADVVLGATTYAYVPGRFPIALPAGPLQVEVAHGFAHRPIRRTIDVDDSTSAISLALEPVATALPEAEGWIAADCHVHFISPTSALLQAQAEGVNVVNLLATQWGDHHTSVTDLPAVAVGDAAGRHLVVMGSENRQTMLGHIGLLGAADAVLPMASAGSPEGRLGDPLDTLLADWSETARAGGGLAIAVHFPLPYAEVAADIVTGAVEAVELQALTPDVDGPSIREWYRYLNCGFRLPVVGGTDKMTSEIALGGIRTYARLAAGEQPTFAGWAAAVRAGRTIVSSGASLRLEVDGHEPGDVLRMSGGGTVEVRAAATAAQAVLGRLELVHDGIVVAATGGTPESDRIEIAERVEIRHGGWIAARVTSPHHIESAFATAMGAHTSPVYVEVPGRPAFDPEAAAGIATIIDGTRLWIETIAVTRSPRERQRLAAHLGAARRRLDDLARHRRG